MAVNKATKQTINVQTHIFANVYMCIVQFIILKISMLTDNDYDNITSEHDLGKMSVFIWCFKGHKVHASLSE